MKKLFLSSALTSSFFNCLHQLIAGPGESLGNTINSCNTSVGDCNITPTKFST